MNKKIRYIKIRDEQPKKKKNGKQKKEKVMRAVGNALTVIGTTISSMLLVLVIMMCIVVTVVTVYILDFKDSSVEINLKETDMKYTSIIYAYNADGQEVELKRLVKEENRIWVDYEDISPNIINAVIAKEDKRFWDHKGVDWRRTVAALVYDILGTDKEGQGGSTITQQLIKNITEDNDKTWERKLREIFRALDLEEKYNKEQILESYLNRIAFGGMNYGIGAASEIYFGKTADQLDIAEAAILAGIIKNPEKYNPYANLEKCKEQQLWVLNEMFKQGYINTAEYETAKVEQVMFKKTVYGDAFGYIDPRSIASEDTDNSEGTPEEADTYEAYTWNGTYKVSQNWYTDAAINQVVADYAELKGISITSARNEIYNGGFKIYTNMDMEKQAILEEKFKDPHIILTKYDKSTPEEDLLQAAMIIMDYSGTVLALVGGVGEKPGDNCFNRATMATRSPGSTMKPIGPYSTGIQENVIYYSMLMPDRGLKVKDSDELWPHNYGNMGGLGELRTMWSAVRDSLNTVAVRVTRELTPQVVYNQLTQNLGFSTLVESDIDLAPVSLGALTTGVKLLEHTAAYQIFGNGGVYYEPKLYSRVIDSRGNIILEQNFYGTQAIDSDTSWITNRMMRKVVSSPSNIGARAALDNVEVIGKTGSSNSGYDLLFAGCTPNYVAIVWQGNDKNKDVDTIPYKKYAPVTWHDVMVDIEDTTTISQFTPDPSTIERKYCTETGLLASSSCHSTEIGYYRASNIPPYCSGNHEEEIKKINEHWDAVDAAYEPQSNLNTNT
ncbi:MAG: transglycosylase domain-containing protein [Oscillospiraceae bacterium]